MMAAKILKGGDKLKRRLREIARNLDRAGSVRVGFLENATYPDGKAVAMVAALNEFGVPARNQPPRPFFRRMIAAKSQEWPDAIAKLAKAEDYRADRILDLAGSAIAGQLRQSITDLTDPPLSPKTVKKKGFDKPLVDTGHMLASVDHEVETK